MRDTLLGVCSANNAVLVLVLAAATIELVASCLPMCATNVKVKINSSRPRDNGGCSSFEYPCNGKCCTEWYGLWYIWLIFGILLVMMCVICQLWLQRQKRKPRYTRHKSFVGRMISLVKKDKEDIENRPNPAAHASNGGRDVTFTGISEISAGDERNEPWGPVPTYTPAYHMGGPPAYEMEGSAPENPYTMEPATKIPAVEGSSAPPAKQQKPPADMIATDYTVFSRTNLREDVPV